MMIENVKVVGALSRDMKAELQSRGYWVVRPFWRTFRDRFNDRYGFAMECGLGRCYAFLWALL